MKKEDNEEVNESNEGNEEGKGVGGRPKGSTAKIGLDFKKRMKILNQIIRDEKTKPADRLAAIKQMTDALSDKVRVNDDDAPIMVIRFEEDLIAAKSARCAKKKEVEVVKSMTYVENKMVGSKEVDKKVYVEGEDKHFAIIENSEINEVKDKAEKVDKVEDKEEDIFKEIL